VKLLSLLACLMLIAGTAWPDEAGPANIHVSVSGEVHAPDQYEITAGSSIADLLAKAGGANEMSADIVYLSHTDDAGHVRRYSVNLKDPRRTAATGWLREGDTLEVPRAEQFSISGEVNKPGTYRLDSGLTISQAIAKAGDVTVYGSPKTAVISRKGNNGAEQTIKVQPDDFVEPGDQIRVKPHLF
jgi:polysaccharide export outer membrane protein